MLLNERANTFFEVFITLLVITLLISVSVPSVHILQGNSVLKREAQALTSLIERLQLRSIQAEENIILNIANDHYSALQQDSTPIESHKLQAPLKFSEPQNVTFYSSGVTTPLTIEIKSHNFACLITISLRGRITKSC